MNTSKKARNTTFLLRIMYVCILLALVTAACVTACLAVSTSYEAGARYFSDTPNATVFWIIMSAAIFFSFASLFIFKKDPINLSGMPNSLLSTVRALNVIPALLALYVAYFALTDESLEKWGNIILLFSTVSALFFVLKIFPALTVPKVIFAIGVFAFSALIISSLYLDHIIELNSHFKLLVQFGAIGIILGTIADARSFISESFFQSTDPRKNEFIKIKTGGYLFLKSVSLVLCISCATAVLLCFAKGNTAFGESYRVYSLFYVAYTISTFFEIACALISSIKSHI